MRKPTKWKTFSLDTRQSIIDDSMMLATQSYYTISPDRYKNIEKTDKGYRDCNSDEDSDEFVGVEGKVEESIKATVVVESELIKVPETVSLNDREEEEKVAFNDREEEEKVQESLRDDIIDDDEDDKANLATG